MPQIFEFPTRVREARELVHSAHEKCARITQENAHLIASSRRAIENSRKLLSDMELVLPVVDEQRREERQVKARRDP